MIRSLVLGLMLATLALPAGALAIESELQKECDGYRYVPLEGAKPLLLMYGGGIRTAWLADHADYAATLGFEGFLITGIMSDQTSDIWAADGDPRTLGQADAAFQDARRANAACRSAGIVHNFVEVAFSGTLPDWWDDLAWAKIHDNFRQAARFARAAGFAGICIDSEYVGEQYHYLWPGYAYDHYGTAELRRMARERMSEMAGAMYDEFPGMEFFLVHSDDAPLAFEMLAGWIEEAARRDAPGGLHVGTEGSYDACSVAYILAQSLDRARLVEERLSPRGKAYWRQRCGMSPGGWPLRIDQDESGHASKAAYLTVPQFRAMMAGLKMASARYAWIFPNGPSWWQASEEEVEQYGLSQAAALPVAPEADAYYHIARTPEQVTDPALLAASRALRTMSLDDAEALIGALGLRPIYSMLQPDNQITRAMVRADDRRYDWTADRLAWLAAEQAAGRRPNVTEIFGFAREFSVIGPFGNAGWEGQDRVYPPEERIDLGAACEGMAGPAAWQQVTVPDGQGYLDFADYFEPTDWTVAYALVYVHSPQEQPAQIRTGTNDAVKLWFNGRLLHQVQPPWGRWAVVDDDIVPVLLPAGRSSILVKVAQTTGRWGMYLRISDEAGRPLEGVTFTALPKGD